MGESVFSSCLRLIFICIPSSVEIIIPGYCFHSCTSLAMVTIENPWRVFSLGELTFAYCQALTSICVPSATETISNWCFRACGNLAIVTLAGGSKLSVLGQSPFFACGQCNLFVFLRLWFCFMNCTNLATLKCAADWAMWRYDAQGRTTWMCDAPFLSQVAFFSLSV
jgi:hypothetical protein